ncbi:MAG: manganese efflux pump MntP family protein [Halanaerobiaceae bacterium]
MNWLEAVVIAVALGTDAFSVAVVLGVQQFTPGQIFQISNYIGVFHIFMPLIGLYGGNYLKNILVNTFFPGSGLEIVDYLGAGLLMLIGGYMIIETRFPEKCEVFSCDFTGWSGLVLALSVSMDSFSTGVGLGILDFNIAIVFLFGFIAAVMMGSGLYLGSRIGSWAGESAQVVGGLALIGLALHFSGLV